MAQWIRFERNGRLEFGTLQGGEIVVHQGDMFAGASPSGERVRLSDVRVATPCDPSKMICLWNNFHQLAAKNDFKVPDEPLYFLKAPNAYLPHGEPIRRQCGKQTGLGRAIRLEAPVEVDVLRAQIRKDADAELDAVHTVKRQRVGAGFENAHVQIRGEHLGQRALHHGRLRRRVVDCVRPHFVADLRVDRGEPAGA